MFIVVWDWSSNTRMFEFALTILGDEIYPATFKSPTIPTPPATFNAPVVDVVEALVLVRLRIPLAVISDKVDVLLTFNVLFVLKAPLTFKLLPVYIAPIIPTPPATVKAPLDVVVAGVVFVILVTPEAVILVKVEAPLIFNTPPP